MKTITSILSMKTIATSETRVQITLRRTGRFWLVMLHKIIINGNNLRTPIIPAVQIFFSFFESWNQIDRGSSSTDL